MWKYSKNKNCFYNLDLEDGKFWFTDLNTIYLEKDITTITLKKRFIELNPRIEYNEGLVISNLTEIPKNSSLSTEGGNSNNLLNLKYDEDSGGFNFCWNLRPAEDKIKDMLINPILLALNSLVSKNEELIDIIKKKDIEIEQYKIEGAVLQRRLVATKKFEEEEFNSKHVHIKVDEFVSYGKHNQDSLLKDCKHFVEIVDEHDNSNLSNKSESNSPQKLVISKRKRALENRRKQNIEKIKRKQELTYEDEDSS